MRTSMRRARRFAVWFVFVSCSLLGVAEVRLLELQVVQARTLDQSSIYRIFKVPEHARRGDILDARGGMLATTHPEAAVVAWTGALEGEADRLLVASELARIAGVDRKSCLAQLEKPRHSVKIAAGLRDPAVITALRTLSTRPEFRALTVEVDYVRDYPRGATLAPLVGWVGWQPFDLPKDDPRHGKDGAVSGVAGIEAECDEKLTPKPGHRLVERDGRSTDMVEPDLEGEAARDGRAVQLTIDPLAQQLVEESIDAAMAEFEPEWAQVVVLEPHSSEVIALAQRPTPPAPTPLSGKKDEVASHLLMAIDLTFPPGSAFKPFMLGKVLDEGKCTPETEIDCENGVAAFGKRVIHDVHPKGLLSATGVLVESSNIGMTKLVLRLVPPEAKTGSPEFGPVLAHIRNLGFGDKAAGLRGEATGRLPPAKKMQRYQSLASLAFGQEILVTAMQMAAAGASVANGGTWHKPRLVHAIEGDDGALVPVVPEAKDERPTFTAATCAALRRMMTDVVDEGGSKRWRPKGYSLAGKTGTAQDEKNHDISITSFWTYAPANDPKFLVLVVLRRPRHGRFAADNAAKVASEVMGALLRESAVPFDRPEDFETGVVHENGLHPESIEPARDVAGVVASPTVGEGR